MTKNYLVMELKEKNLADTSFVRKFSVCLFKNKKFLLGEMEFSKNFIRTDRGNKYPVLFSEGEYAESIESGEYVFQSENGNIARLLGHLSPYATYEAELSELDGECGFVFVNGDKKAAVMLQNNGGNLVLRCGKEKIISDFVFGSGMSLMVLNRKNKFDVYIKKGAFPVCAGSFNVPVFEDSDREDFFLRTSAGLVCSGSVKVKKVSFYMDSGISQADIRPVRYENGEVLFRDGKMFFTVSVRLEEGCCQGVFSWVPGTEEFELTGTLFFDSGDGIWANDVASSLLYNRQTGKWLLWVCAFSHGHILARSEFSGEPLFGKNVIDVKLLPCLKPTDDDTVFGGKPGDEDPDLYYDAEHGKWLLAICRISSEGSYRYHFFESESPLDGFSYIGRGLSGAETGGSFLPYGGKLYFICGNSFEEHSDYRIYEWGDFKHPAKLQADFPDGGFRGWGTVFTVKQASREKLYHLTFDRHKGSAWNWSYGNLYCFEGIG